MTDWDTEPIEVPESRVLGTTNGTNGGGRHVWCQECRCVHYAGGHVQDSQREAMMNTQINEREAKKREAARHPPLSVFEELTQEPAAAWWAASYARVSGALLNIRYSLKGLSFKFVVRDELTEKLKELKQQEPLSSDEVEQQLRERMKELGLPPMPKWLDQPSVEVKLPVNRKLERIRNE